MLQYGYEFYTANAHAYDYLKSSNNFPLTISEFVYRHFAKSRKAILCEQPVPDSNTLCIYSPLYHVMYKENKPGDVTKRTAT